MKSTGEIDKNGVEVFEGDKLYCNTTGHYCVVVKNELDDKLYIKFENETVLWNPTLLEIWDMEVV